MPRRHRTGNDPRRGRHRRASSPETQAWLDAASAGTDADRTTGPTPPTPTPARPPWMPTTTYRELVNLRAQLEHEAAA